MHQEKSGNPAILSLVLEIAKNGAHLFRSTAVIFI
jgi:hypothetical protein